MAIINFINQSDQKEPVSIVVFSQADSKADNMFNVVWRTFPNVQHGQPLSIDYPAWGFLEVSYSGGHRTDKMRCNEGQRFRLMNADGIAIEHDGEAATMDQVEIVNLLDEPVDIIYYKGSSPQDATALHLIAKLGTNELAELNVSSKLCFAIAPELNTGAIIRSNTPLQDMTVIDIKGKATCSVILTGGGRDPYTFKMEEGTRGMQS